MATWLKRAKYFLSIAQVASLRFRMDKKYLCDENSPSACQNLGALYHNGEGVSQSLEKAAELYEKSCEQGEALGCSNLGFLYRRGHGVPASEEKAKSLFQRSCDMGYFSFCQ